MEDKIRAEFLSRIRKIYDYQLEESRVKIKTGFEEELPIIMKELLVEIEHILEQYTFQQEFGDNGTLRWVYLSFLRSSVLDNSACYRLDFYDERDRYSVMECSGNWAFSYTMGHLHRIQKLLKVEFGRQTRVKEFEMDSLSYYIAEVLWKEAKQLIPVILQRILEEHGSRLFSGSTVNFMLGELFDKSELILQWDGKMLVIPTDVKANKREEKITSE